MKKHFTHLHVHSEYSLLDGAISVKKLVNFAKDNKMQAIGISDHGNIFGAVKFFQTCKKHGIKPVLGMECYLTEDVEKKDLTRKYYHLLILVENEIGYKNLCKLIAFSYNEGFYFKPRIDYKTLEKHSQGLIVASACLGGHLPTLMVQEKDKEVEKWLDWYLKIFGPEKFFLEVQPNNLPEQKILNEKIWELSQKKGLDVIATCDAHYPRPEDRDAHEVMLSIQTRHKITDPDRMTFGECRAFLRTTEEMLEFFKDHPECVWNTGKIADQCNFEFETGKLFFPKFEVPKKFNQDTYLKKLCSDGLESLLKNGFIEEKSFPVYKKRLKLEYDLITKMGFTGYFLVVSDFIKWAKDNNIPVGPGRGSVAGSLLAWTLGITDVDPIKYALFFERFLNPERISMPDIDVDFCIEGRDKVIEYVRQKYGNDKVCQIITFGTMMAKGVIKDVARVLGFPFEDSNALTDMIPDTPKIKLQEAIESEPKLQQLIENNTQVKELFDLAFRLEGITRHASKHAAGVVISPSPVSDMLPVYVPPRTNELVTQYAMNELEYLGFLKMDFLGLKNLTLIQRVIYIIEKNHNIKIDLNKLPLDDKKTFKLLAKGDTAGVFQLESDGLRDILRRMKPCAIEDIIAVNALYRPGPLGSGMVEDYIERKLGKKKVEYLFPELEPVLKDTYGVILFQEQVMQTASTIAGYSLGEADILRRAMGKKKVEEMAKQRPLFIKKARKKSFNEKKAGELFDLMAYFSGYGFNKAHATAYGLIAYQTAYLKANFPTEFMASLISLEVSSPDKMAFYIEQAKDLGLVILPPDINFSSINFDVTEISNNPGLNTQKNKTQEIKEKPGKKLAIRFGLWGIKNLGMATIEEIIKERKKSGNFKDILDLCMRLNLRTCNKRALESLVCSGALDSLNGSRFQKFSELSKIMEIAAEKKKRLLTGQMGLFDPKKEDKTEHEKYSFSNKEKENEWNDKTKLQKEKEVLGVYISARPLDTYRSYLNCMNYSSIKDIESPEKSIVCCGVVNSIRNITTKKGDAMAFVQFEDNFSKAEVILFPRVYSVVSDWLKEHIVFAVSGTTDLGRDGLVKIKAQHMIPLDLIFSEGIGIGNLTLYLTEPSPESFLENFKSKLKSGQTKLSFLVEENNKKVKIHSRKKILFNLDLMQFLEKNNISMKIGMEEISRRRF